MFRFIFVFLFFIFFNNVCISFSKNSFYFGVEGSSVRNYFEIDLLPVNFMSCNLLFLDKYKNDKNILNQKTFNVTKYFLNYLKEIKTSDFSFIKGGSFFIGYQINDYLSLNFGKGYFFYDINIRMNNFNELFKNQLIKNSIGKYRCSSECKWVDLFKFFEIEKKLFFLFSFGFDFSETEFKFFSNEIYDSYKISVIEQKKFNIKVFDSYNLSKKKKITENDLKNHTILYKKNKKIDLKEKNINCYKICLDHLLGMNFSSNRKGIRIGFGTSLVITSNLCINFLFKYHFFINNFNNIKILSEKSISTNFNFVYKI